MDNRRRMMRKQLAVAVMKLMLIFPVYAGWSGILYPDLTFQNGVCRAYSADGEERKEVTGQEFYEEVLEAEPEQVHIKSRLLEFLRMALNSYI